MEFISLASGSGGNCYRLSDGVANILIECGIQQKRILKGINYDIQSMSGVLISHCHLDHSLCAKELAKLGMDIYSSEGTFEALKLSGHRFHVIKARQIFEIGTLRIYPFETQHDCPEPLGFFIISNATKERLLFFTDTYYVKEVFKGGFDYIAGECNYSLDDIAPELNQARKKRLYGSHMSLEHFLDFLKSNDLSRLKEIWLLHMSDDNGNAEKFKREVQKATGVVVNVC